MIAHEWIQEPVQLVTISQLKINKAWMVTIESEQGLTYIVLHLLESNGDLTNHRIAFGSERIFVAYKRMI